MLSSHDNIREVKKYSNMGMSKRHIYLRELDPQIEVKSSQALAPLVMSYRPTQPSKEALHKDDMEKERIN